MRITKYKKLESKWKLSFMRLLYHENKIINYMKKHLFSMLKNIWGNIAHGWSLDTRSLSLFRVALALLVIADIALRSRYIVEHYTDMGVYPRTAFIELGTSSTTFSLHAVSGHLWFQILLFGIHIFFALWLLFGYRVRTATILLWLLTVSLHNRNMMINSGADDLLRLVLFWSMFLPLDRYWSWDQERYSDEKKITLSTVISLGAFAFIVQQCLLYWVTAYLKLGPEWYITHSAVYEILALETFHLPLSDIIFHSPKLLRFLSGASMAVEFLAPLFLISPIFKPLSRYVGICAIICLHVGILTNISVGIFPWISIISMLALLPGHFWDKIIGKLGPQGSLVVFYDDACSFCNRWIRILQSYGTLFGIKYRGLSQAKPSIQKISHKNTTWVVVRGGKTTLGYSGFLEIVRQSWILRIFSGIGNFGPIKIMGDFIYSLISKKRKYCEIRSPLGQFQESKIKKITSNILIIISLYCVLIVNISIVSCQGSWKGFFQAWPMSFVDILRERNYHLFEGEKNAGWLTRDFRAPRKAQSCFKSNGYQYTFIEKNTWLKNLFLGHLRFISRWTFAPRIDQFWGMFAPDPINIDYWFVIDGELMTKNRDIIHRDIWRDYVFGERSEKNISLEKYANPHKITLSDRWRKYTYNILGSDERYMKYFAGYWCHKYNTPESFYYLRELTIYGISEKIKPNYTRGETESKILYEHCCSKDNCTLNSPATTDQ